MIDLTMPPRLTHPPGLPRDRLHKIANLLHAAALNLVHTAAEADTRGELQPVDRAMLSLLVYGGPKPMSSLAELGGVRPPTISKLVAGLERRGLVERVAGYDRRVMLAEATERGRALLGDSRRCQVQAVAGRIGLVGEEDRETLAQAAMILRDIFQPAVFGMSLGAARPTIDQLA
jgi:DNA-binding MarR family transcriptional regulator